MKVAHQYQGRLFSLVREYATEEVISDLESKVSEKNWIG